MRAPLTGIRVLDFTRVLAGPYCTKLLRDLGADILKVEPPAGDISRLAVPQQSGISLYFAQQNAGKRAISVDLNFEEGRNIVRDLLKDVDIVVQNFRPGTIDRFGFGYEDVHRLHPRIIYASLSGYGQSTSWRGRPAYAPTVQAEIGYSKMVNEHFGEALTELRGDACSHADLYTGLQGVIGILAALHQREVTGEGQHVDVAMAAVMLSMNERAGALLSGIDTDGEPLALAAPDSHFFRWHGDIQITIASSPLLTPIFGRFCMMMRRNDLLRDPRFLTAKLRRENLKALLEEIRCWMLTFSNLDDLQAQVSDSGLAIGCIRDLKEFAASEWVAEWGAIQSIDDRSGGTLPMPGPPWQFSESTLPSPGVPSFQGEHNSEVLKDLGISDSRYADLRERRVIIEKR